MKKIILTFALVAMATISYSQFGIKAGAGLSEFYYGYDRDIRPKVGVVAGFYNLIYLNKRFTIEPQLLYHSKGTLINHDPTEDRNADQFRMNLAYIEMPITVGVNFGNLNIHAGGYVAHLVKFNINKWNYDNTITEFSPDKIRTFDYGYALGVMYDCYGGTFEVSSTIGRRVIGKKGDVFSHEDVTPEYRHVYKNRTLEVTFRRPFKIRE